MCEPLPSDRTSMNNQEAQLKHRELHNTSENTQLTWKINADTLNIGKIKTKSVTRVQPHHLLKKRMAQYLFIINVETRPP